MKPPVDAPTSRQSRPAGSTPSASRRVRELVAAARDVRRRLLDRELAPLVHLLAGLRVAADEAGHHERLRLRAALGEPALDEEDVEALAHERRLACGCAPLRPETSSSRTRRVRRDLVELRAGARLDSSGEAVRAARARARATRPSPSRTSSTTW